MWPAVGQGNSDGESEMKVAESRFSRFSGKADTGLTTVPKFVLKIHGY